MADKVTLNTKTSVTRTGDTIEIYTFYDDGSLPDILLAFITSNSGTYNDVVYQEGYGIVDYKIGTSNLNIYIDESTGIAYIDSTDSSSYSINSSTGQLQYTA